MITSQDSNEVQFATSFYIGVALGIVFRFFLVTCPTIWWIRVRNIITANSNQTNGKDAV